MTLNSQEIPIPSRGWNMSFVSLRQACGAPQPGARRAALRHGDGAAEQDPLSIPQGIRVASYELRDRSAHETVKGVPGIIR